MQPQLEATMFMRTRLRHLLLTASLLCSLFTSSAFANAPATDVYFDVAVRGTGSATIHGDIFNNPSGRGVTTVLAVHGFTEVGSMWKPLADAIFADPALGKAVKRIVALDMIGHGESSMPTLPSGTKFGDLLIEDNVSVVIQSIDILRARGLGAQVIMGHSMGGLEVQAAQEALLASNSSLAKHGIFGAVLVDAVPARGTVWTMPPPNPNTANFVVTDPILGTYLNLPAAAGPVGGGFTKLDGTLAPNTPPAATFVANGWIGPEPIALTLELTGTAAPLWRPFVRQNAFTPSKGTILSVIAGSQDVLTPIVDQDDLYTYLTGLPSTSITLYRPIVTDDAVHSMYVSNPTGLLQALRNGVF
jgi:pimeloyl-ACP methyl ester carboxylesterase